MSVDTQTPLATSGARPWDELRRNPLFWIAASVLSVIVVTGVFAPLIAPHDPDFSRLDLVNAPAGADALLGGDSAGRDVLSRLIFATQTTLIGVIIAVSVSMLIGLVSGLLAGYRGGVIDETFNWVANLIIVLPSMMVLIAMFATVGPSTVLTMVVLGVILAPNFFRLVRNQTVAVRNELYVDAARVSGVSPVRIVFRHILRVIIAPVIIMAASIGSLSIMMQSGLAFLGLGDAKTPTWGAMLLDAFKNIYTAPQLMIWPGVMIALTAGSLLLLANALRDTVAGTRRVRRAPRQRSAPTGPTAGRSEGTPLLALREVSIAFSKPDGSDTVVVDSTDICVEAGEIVGLVGESGSGKTQTILSVLDLLADGGRVRSGTISLDGVVLSSLSPRRRREVLGRNVGYIPQEPMSNLDPSFTIGSQLVEPLTAVAGLTGREARERSLELLRRVGITDPQRVFDSYPHQISGGMAQRVLIAGAVACDPKLLIADEPTTALDVTVQAEILEVIRSLQQERGLGVLLVTHNLGVVADLCDRVVVMKDGAIRERGDVRQVLLRPEDEYTRSLLSSTLATRPAREAWTERLATGSIGIASIEKTQKAGAR